MRVHVDFKKCEAHGECMMYAPDVFEVRDDDFLYVLQEQPAESVRDDVVAAANSCPTQAITLEV
ncbi:hypothetical protein GCM10023321_13820 [Pseudonocardia eucalypti]|uniref:Ferredoxin n=1 Tax=Pseudonocardia eucalypti TaxID=648755 RepID=A0ABP9PV93_9PSEU|nr:ferredoxin [Pseudonocardia eucalypti]